VGLCHHKITRPEVTGRADDLQSGAQLRMHLLSGVMKRGGPPDWWLGGELTKHHNLEE
jgi:hypothetical protein